MFNKNSLYIREVCHKWCHLSDNQVINSVSIIPTKENYISHAGRALWLPVVSAYLLRVMLQWVRSRGPWLPGPLVQSVPAGGLRGSLRGVHESMDLVHYVDGQPIAATLLVASKISLRLLWWPPTEHQCVLIYICVFTHVCCWLFFCWE